MDGDPCGNVDDLEERVARSGTSLNRIRYGANHG